LEDRQQCVGFNGEKSQLRKIDLGVPQSSVLRPLMFILYITDIGSAIEECQFYLFADDTLLSISGNSVKECIKKLNRDLEKLSKWLKFNKLKLNVNKTKYMIIAGRRSNIMSGAINLTNDGESIERVDVIKYLGVEIDEKLNFKQHIDKTVKKMAKKVGRIQQKLTKTAEITNYKSIVSFRLLLINLIFINRRRSGTAFKLSKIEHCG
jgi:uncharacterized protein YunC (DUF1805 family)